MMLLFIGSIADASPRDSIIYRDTTLYRYRTEKKLPLGLTFGGGVGFLTFSDNKNLIPYPVSAGCDTFARGTSTKPYFEAGLDVPLNNSFHFHPQLSYRSLGADHTFEQTVLQRPDSTIQTVQLEHTITNTTKAIGLDALFDWNLVEGLKFSAGPSLYFLFDQNFTKRIHRVTPPQNLDTVEQSGALPNAKSILPAISFRAGYEVPLSQKLFAMPNVSAMIPLTGITDYFKFYSINAGISFRYEFEPHYDTTREEYHEQIQRHILIAEVPKKKFNAEIEAFATGPDGKREQVARLEVQEVKARNAYPMLNYIFFDSASANIPSRYITYASTDEAARNFKGSLERRGERTNDLYLETLNILGDRLRKFPQATVKLIGSTSNTGAETANYNLAKQRAESVRDYLEHIWKIEPNRIMVVGKLLPDKPSPNTISEGQAENRRVEIVTTDEKITDPLYVTNIEHTATPPQLEILPIFAKNDTLSSYHISIRIGGKEIKTFDEDASSNPSQSKDWTITEDALAAHVDSLEIALTANDVSGNRAEARTAIGLEQKKIEREEEQQIDRFSLILFNFDESALGVKNERTLGIVAEALRKIKPKKLSIRGYTDELGDDEHNNVLSKQRAEQAANKLIQECQKRNISLPHDIIVEGRGSHERLYDNRLPEGRFFSRTVMVTIER
jgi:outer membrane protein OmpA-like peptidoglycan-associated protein